MSEISKDLQDQLRAQQDPLLRRFLEQKPGYDGPTLSTDEEAKIKAEERRHSIEDRLREEIKRER